MTGFFLFIKEYSIMEHSFFSFYESIHQRLSEHFQKQLAEQYTWTILSFVFSRSKTELIAHSPEITATHIQKIDQIVYELIELEKPIAYIIGSVPFLDLHLITKPPVLIPRPETEQLVFMLITLLQPFKDQSLSVLDIGTGSGCIALSFAHYFPHFSVTAMDISEAALALCRQNAEKNTSNNITILYSDLFSGVEKKDFDFIISNPPYISEAEFQYLDLSVKNWEDPRALVSGQEGFALLSKIIDTAPHYTNKNSLLAQHNIPQLVVEIGHRQAKKVSDMMQNAGYHTVTVWKDQYKKDRAVFGASLQGAISR
jgi:release factor glutamine methyltransferase